MTNQIITEIEDFVQFNRDPEVTERKILGIIDENIALIQNGTFDLGETDDNGDTALMLACYNGLEQVALKLIETGKSKPEQVDYDGNTALILAFYTGLEQVALKLIETGKSKPEQANVDGTTALMLACYNRLENLALKLIETGQFNPEQVNVDGTTALILACKNGFENIALKLIETGESNAEYVDIDGNTALMYATSNNLINVVNAINAIFLVNINEEGFNNITQETKIIQEHLNENHNNIVFKIKNNYYLTSKGYIRIQLRDSKYIKYGCKKAGEGSIYIEDENIDYNTEYFSLSAILGLQLVVRVKEIQEIIKNQYSANIYVIECTNVELPGIISKAFVNGADGESADHCQSGKKTTVCRIKRGFALCVSNKKDGVVSVSQEEDQEHSVKILYKGISYKIPIHIDVNIGELKSLFLNELVSKGVNTTLNFTVKFFYSGRIINQDDIELKTLANPPFGIALQAMVTPKTGGKRTKRTMKRRNKNRNKKSQKKGKSLKRKYK